MDNARKGGTFFEKYQFNTIPGLKGEEVIFFCW